jgi:hypothetical protein
LLPRSDAGLTDAEKVPKIDGQSFAYEQIVLTSLFTLDVVKQLDSVEAIK